MYCVFYRETYGNDSVPCQNREERSQKFHKLCLFARASVVVQVKTRNPHSSCILFTEAFEQTSQVFFFFFFLSFFLPPPFITSVNQLQSSKKQCHGHAVSLFSPLAVASIVYLVTCRHFFQLIPHHPWRGQPGLHHTPNLTQRKSLRGHRWSSCSLMFFSRLQGQNPNPFFLGSNRRKNQPCLTFPPATTTRHLLF